jgi:hypothetical protein
MRMEDHIHSHYALNPLPGERQTGLAAARMPTPVPAQGQVFCRFCGQSIFAEAVLCVHCGRQVKELQAPVVAAEPKPPEHISWHIGEMVGLIFLTMFCPIVGYIYGYIGSKELGKERQAKILMIVAAAFNILYFYAYVSAHTPPQP